MKVTSLTEWTRVVGTPSRGAIIVDMCCMQATVRDFKDGRRVWLEVAPEVVADLRDKLNALGEEVPQ